MISFCKYHGSGNDFIIVDDRAETFPCTNAEFIKKICNRQFGVGADGLLLLQTSNCASFRIRIFNSDGKEVGMCGNGIRCFVSYLKSLGYKDDLFLIETMNDTVQCRTHSDKISVKLSKPIVLHWGVKLDHLMEHIEAFVVHTGVPHAVIFVDDLDGMNVDEVGRKIRQYPLFHPEGVNVNFVRKGADGSLRVRTYERGVEAETLSSGTGAAAVALTAYMLWNIPSPVRIMPLSQDCLEVHVNEARFGGKELELTGRASFIFEGRLTLNSFL